MTNFFYNFSKIFTNILLFSLKCVFCTLIFLQILSIMFALQEEKLKEYRREKKREKKRKFEEELTNDEDDIASIMGFSGFGSSKK